MNESIGTIVIYKTADSLLIPSIVLEIDNDTQAAKIQVFGTNDVLTDVPQGLDGENWNFKTAFL